MKYNRTELAENIGFSSVIDEKFKTASITVRFITELDKETIAPNALGMGVLSCSTGSFKTLAELNEKLSSLYGAGLSSFVRKTADVQILGVSASWIVNRYAIDGEDINGEMLDIVRDCLFNPNVSDGEFDADSFKITKKDLLDRIDSEINNKRGYAISKASEIAFRGEPAELSVYGNKESAEAVTAAQAYQAYLKLLETAQVEIFFCSPEENNAFMEMFRENFSAINRNSESHTFRNISPLKSEIETSEETLDVRQCKMVLNFKSDSDDIYALKMLSVIFGETPVSKLFMNVREKLSLCYYCASRFVSSKNTLMVDSGVENYNIEKARTEILNQLNEIRNGNITDEELESALLALDNVFTSVGDTPSSYSSWYFDCFCDGKILTPEEKFMEYKNVTKARIVQAANSVKPDSAYYMLNKEGEE